MKNILIQVTAFAILSACSLKTGIDPYKTFIPGTYVRLSQHEFGTENDTITIYSQKKFANEYRIVRSWEYKRVLDGDSIPPEYKVAVTSGIYNPDQKILLENETGDKYSFDIDQQAMFVGTTKYKKLK